MDPTEHQELCNFLSASKILSKEREIIEEKHPNFVQVFVNILYGSKKYDFWFRISNYRTPSADRPQ